MTETLAARLVAPVRTPAPPWTTCERSSGSLLLSPGSRGMVGRSLERDRIEVFVAEVARTHRSLVLRGEAGIGKTTLWTYGLGRCRAAGWHVLTTRPTADDQHTPTQGLRDLFTARHLDGSPASPAFLTSQMSLIDRSRGLLDHLQGLAATGPVVLAIDDVPYLDDVSAHALRFALRRLAQAPVVLFGTARSGEVSFQDVTPMPDLGVDEERLDIAGLDRHDIRRVILNAVPQATVPVAVQAGEASGGNPFFAVELARLDKEYSRPLDADATRHDVLMGKVAGFAPDTLRLARFLSLSGPGSVETFRAAWGIGDLGDALHTGLDEGVFTLTETFTLRFSHPLISAAVRSGMNALDRQRLHGALATAVPDPDARSVHLARSSDCRDSVRACEIEEAASRVARRGAQALAAELAGHAVRLTPTGESDALVRRALAQMTHCAASGDLSSAIAIADEQLLRLPPGRLRAQMITGRVVLDFTDAEAFLLAALTDIPPLCQDRDEDDRATVRARLLGLLAWLLAIHFGRPEEGLRWGWEALAIGRAHQDTVLIAQAASVVSTASLLLGQRQDTLIAEAESLSRPVVHSQLALWPQVIRGRQHLWDGHLEQARDKLMDMTAAPSATDRSSIAPIACAILPRSPSPPATSTWRVTRWRRGWSLLVTGQTLEHSRGWPTRPACSVPSAAMPRPPTPWRSASMSGPPWLTSNRVTRWPITCAGWWPYRARIGRWRGITSMLPSAGWTGWDTGIPALSRCCHWPSTSRPCGETVMTSRS